MRSILHTYDAAYHEHEPGGGPMISFASLASRTSPLIIAHRGASEQARENTTAAFESAIALGADAIECDIRRTACGTIVVHHDPVVPGSSVPIALQSFVDVNRIARKSGYEIPTLAQVVAQCAERVALDVELKETGYEEAVVEVVSIRYSYDQVIFKSFKDQTVARIHRMENRVHVGLLIGAPRTVAFRSRATDIAIERRLSQCGATFVAPHWARLRFGFMRKMRSLGMPVVVWTVDRPAMARLLIRKRVAAIVTNVPDRMMAVVRS